MEPIYIDLLYGLGGLIVGGGLKSFYDYKKASHWTAKLPTLVPTVGREHKDKCYVRFHYLDGRVDVRPFLSTDLDTTLIWKERYFKIGEWTVDGQVYNEISRPDWKQIVFYGKAV